MPTRADSVPPDDSTQSRENIHPSEPCQRPTGRHAVLAWTAGWRLFCVSTGELLLSRDAERGLSCDDQNAVATFFPTVLPYVLRVSRTPVPWQERLVIRLASK